MGTKDGRSPLYQEGRAPVPEPVIKVRETSSEMLTMGTRLKQIFRRRNEPMGRRFFLVKVENHLLMTVADRFLLTKMEGSSSRVKTVNPFSKLKVQPLKVFLYR